MYAVTYSVWFCWSNLTFVLLAKRKNVPYWWLTAEQRSYSFFYLKASTSLQSAPSPPPLFLLADSPHSPWTSFPLTRRLIVHGGDGCFTIHTETSGRSAFHILGLVIPSVHICHGVFALFDCRGQFNLVFTKCKQKLLCLFSPYFFPISEHNDINVVTT